VPLIHANGVELHYHVQGKGVPIVFVHPPCMGSRVFTYVRNDLARDHKTLLFDFRGHGRSGSSGAKLTIPLLAEDIVGLLEALDIAKAYLCAYSLGSFAALEALLTYPERFLGGILLGGTSEATDWPTRARLKAGLWAGAAKARSLISFPLNWKHADNNEAFYRLRGETRAGDLEKWRDYIAACLGYSATSRLKEIRHPMLLLCGEKDTEFKGYMKVLQEGLENDSSAYVSGIKGALPVFGAATAGELIRSWIGGIGQRPEARRNSVPERTADAGGSPFGDEMVRPAGFEAYIRTGEAGGAGEENPNQLQ